MAKYGVIRINGTQYKVSAGEEILVDKLSDKPVAEVLLVSDDGKIKVGTPKVKGASVKLKVLEEEVKGKKLHVVKYSAKSRYRRKIGFRPQYTKLLVQTIS